MKYLYLSILQLFLTNASIGQQVPVQVFGQNGKPPIDSMAVITWPDLYGPRAVTRDGNYFLYTIQNKPAGHNMLILEGIHSRWRKELIDADGAFFADKDRQVIFEMNDSLFFWPLGASAPERVLAVIDRYTHAISDLGDWLVYRLKSNPSDLKLLNLITGDSSHFDHISDYFLDKSSRMLLLKAESKIDTSTITTLQWLPLNEVHPRTVWTDISTENKKTAVTQIVFSDDGGQLAFGLEETQGKMKVQSIWYFKMGMERAMMSVNDLSNEMPPGYTISINYSPRLQFSGTGKYLLFGLARTDMPPPSSNAVKVDIWSYRDPVLQSSQLVNLRSRRYLYVAIPAGGHRIIRIANEDDEVDCCEPVPDEFVVVNDQQSAVESQNSWCMSPCPSYSLFSIRDSTHIPIDAQWNSDFSLSPRNRYLVYFDTKGKHYYSYDLKTRNLINITRRVPVEMSVEEFKDGLPGIYPNPFGVAGWLTGDTGVFIYDQYDIWQLDLTGKKNPLNITNGYGRAHHIIFRFVYQEEALSDGTSPAAPLLLSAFNTRNKYNGYYRVRPNKMGDPQLLYMGPYIFDLTTSQVSEHFDEGMEPLKAQDVNLWIVQRQSDREAPNYFWTSDFKTYNPISDLHPEAGYNWVSSSLISWRQKDGSISQGVLYKPENFDPHTKYPILFNYYELRSGEMYLFPHPDFTGTNINVAWFTSRGYLIFLPDIHYKKGRAGLSAVEAIVSAAQYLSALPFVDGTKMGVQGHSFGGFETNSVVTHSHLFAAAVSGAGTSDFISSYASLGSDVFKAASRMGLEESFQGRMGATLWERPDLYLQNSPILRIDKVTTPILIMHNKKDESVPWIQGVELFTSLRRLHKKAWMLQYDDGGHGAYSSRDKYDYTMRITQFFNYYLKGAPPPIWMTQGIPAIMKGIKTGYELDHSGRMP